VRLLPQSDKDLSKSLSIHENFFTKNLVKLAAQTRYGAIKSAPLIEDCEQYPFSQIPTAAKAACSNEVSGFAWYHFRQAGYPRVLCVGRRR